MLRAAERRGGAFLAYRDGDGRLALRALEASGRIAVGRLEDNELALAWDPEVSRFHAALECHGGVWTLTDDGISRNGTFVNDERMSGRRRLVDGDLLRVGRTVLLYRTPDAATVETVPGAEPRVLARLTPAEHRVLVALCRPFATARAGATPASNREIAQELSLSLEGVKARIRALFAKLCIEELPQNRKRAELARRALEAGLVTPRDRETDRT